MKNNSIKFCLLFIFWINPFIHANEHDEYNRSVAICAIFQNEARFLKEWIEYHQVIGVEHFYLYNNLSDDDYLTVLSPYIQNGIVDLIEYPFPSDDLNSWDTIQINAYKDCLAHVKGKVKWLAFIDIDEFLLPIQDDDLLSFLNRYDKYGGVTVNWTLFGTSGVQRIPDDVLMIEALLLKGEGTGYYDSHVKSIVRPERVKDITNVHYVNYHEPYYAVDEKRTKSKSPHQFNFKKRKNMIRINHYWSRDMDFFEKQKIPRRIKVGDSIEKILNYLSMLNAEADREILRFAIPLRDRMNMNNQKGNK